MATIDTMGRRVVTINHEPGDLHKITPIGGEPIKGEQISKYGLWAFHGLF